jgi:hypothetical protein
MLARTEESTLRWYVARTQPGREAQALKGLVQQGLRPYFPTVLVCRRSGRRSLNIERALLPAYVFLPLPAYCEPWEAIRHVNGILEHRPFLTWCDEEGESHPRIIPAIVVEVVKAIEARERGHIDEAQFQERLHIGQRIFVEVRDHYGFVSGFFAIVENLAKLDRQGRIRVVAEWLGGSRSIEIRAAQIKAEGFHEAEATP